MKRKFLSVLLCFCMVLTMVPSAFAEDAPTLVAAPLVDRSESPATGKLGDVSVTQTAGENGTVDVTVTASNLVRHANAAETQGLWIGVGVPVTTNGTTAYQSTAIYYGYGEVPQNYTEVGYASESTPGYVDSGWLEQFSEGGKTYVGRYWDAQSLAAKSYKGFIVLREPTEGNQSTAQDQTYTVYNVTFALEPAAATSVVAANLTAVTGQTGPAFGQATAYTAGITDKAITLNATGLKKTTNANGSESYWVGVGLPEETGAQYDWGFGAYTGTFAANDPQPATNGSRTQAGVEGNGNTSTNYTTFYFSNDDQTAWTAATTGYIAVKHSNGTVTAYTITFSVNVAPEEEPPAAPTVTLSAEAGELTTTEETQFGVKGSIGTYEVNEAEGTANTYNITGSVNYIEMTEFNNNVAAEEKGHYVVLKVTSSEEKIKVQNRSAGASVTGGKEITLPAATGNNATGYADTLIIWLDGTQPVDGLANKTFTISAGTGADAKTLVFNFTELALLPETTVTDTSIAVKVDAKEVASLGELLKDSSDAEIDQTEQASAPVKVEGTGENKTLTFTGKGTNAEGTVVDAKKDTTVTLPMELAGVVTSGDTKAANIKVESASGSVTIPSANLSGVSANVEIKVAEGKAADVTSATVENAVTDVQTEVTGLLSANAENGVTVTATSSGNLINNVEEAKAVTVVIKGLDSSKTYVLLCVSNDGKVTSFGEYSGSTEITVKSKHLTTFVPVEKSAISAAALAAIPGDNGKVDDTPATPADYTSVVAANLTAVAGQTGPAFGKATAYTAGITGRAITLTATGLEMTTNAAGSESYWVGVGLPQEAGAQYDWGFGTYSGEFAANDPQPADDGSRTQAGTTTNGVEGTNYTTFYFKGDNQEDWNDATGYIAVKHSNETVTVYTITFSVTLKDETPAVTTPTLVWEDMKSADASAADKAAYYGGKLTISGLDASKTYLVTYDQGKAVTDGTLQKVPRIGQVVSGVTETTLSCQGTMLVMVFEVGSGKTVNDSDGLTPVYLNQTTHGGVLASTLTATE